MGRGGWCCREGGEGVDCDGERMDGVGRVGREGREGMDCDG